ncbi:MAG: hypothetical protein M1816_000187 [Peltula sp. TS41687]|nr:MAG: hypothetical protein M1816_000187 [Peltula sp. TS41687]
MDEDARDDVSQDLYEEVIRYFEEDLGVALTSVLNMAGTWVITVPNNTTEWDRTSYSILRPGVMLSSGSGLSPERLTRSGIKVRNGDGTYITVATHGFPDGRATVYHPSNDGEVLGAIHDRLAYTSISLLQLLPGKSFENQTFDALTSDGMDLPGIQVKGFMNPFHLGRYSIVSMNNPFVGYVEGVHITAEKRKVPSDEPGVPHTWVSNEWIYVDNGREDALQGSCGSVVSDEDGNAICLFRFERKEQPGYAIGVAASTLQKSGYLVSA